MKHKTLFDNRNRPDYVSQKLYTQIFLLGKFGQKQAVDLVADVWYHPKPKILKTFSKTN
jgi:hypothetical protein